MQYSDKNNSRSSHDDMNGSNQFIDEISFPFIPCHFNKHKKFGPQTVISHFNYDVHKSNYILFCNTCFRDLEKKEPNLHPYDIEEFVENFLRKLSTSHIESPKPSPLLGQAYELNQQNIASFKKRIEKEVQVIIQTFEDVTQEVVKMISERRDYMIKCYNSISDLFSQSYELFNIKYERLFKSGDKLTRLKETNENKVKNTLQDVKTAEEYQAFLKELKELDELCSELANRDKKTQELVSFSETLQKLYRTLPPVPINRKPITDFCIANLKQALDHALSQSVLKKNQMIEKITSGLIGFADAENNMAAELLLKTIEMSKQYWVKVPQEGETKQENNEIPDLLEEHSITETPMPDYENDEEDQILSVSINKQADLEKIDNPEITHLEIVSYNIVKRN